MFIHCKILLVKKKINPFILGNPDCSKASRGLVCNISGVTISCCVLEKGRERLS